ncbi:Proteasome subunit beta type-3 [Gonioctena quinquepunctata]|nr:Proteasome subunit beta type-3 [Gonioctena quinquepunctata]
MSILSYNGGAMVAMKGENCVSIAADRRFGVQAQTVATNFEKIFEMGPHLYVGLPGLATDTQTVMEKLKFRKNLYELKENRQISPKVFSAMLSNMLYEKRFGPFFVEPVVAGCINPPNDFVVGGTASAQLYGMCEALWEPNLGPEDLFETTSQALINAFDRDAISGWGATVYIIEKDKVTIKNLKTRMD